jgi:serine/threonine protein kinase
MSRAAQLLYQNISSSNKLQIRNRWDTKKSLAIDLIKTYINILKRDVNGPNKSKENTLNLTEEEINVIANNVFNAWISNLETKALLSTIPCFVANFYNIWTTSKHDEFWPSYTIVTEWLNINVVPPLSKEIVKKEIAKYQEFYRVLNKKFIDYPDGQTEEMKMFLNSVAYIKKIKTPLRIRDDNGPNLPFIEMLIYCHELKDVEIFINIDLNEESKEEENKKEEGKEEEKEEKKGNIEVTRQICKFTEFIQFSENSVFYNATINGTPKCVKIGTSPLNFKKLTFEELSAISTVREIQYFKGLTEQQPTGIMPVDLCIFNLFAVDENLVYFMPYPIASDKKVEKEKKLVLDQFYCLADIIEKNITIKNSNKIAFDIACGLQNLHNLTIVHLDVQPENVIFKEVESKSSIISNTNALLLNSELGRSSSSFTQRETLGHRGYRAPELLFKKFPIPYTGAADVWSFGMLLLNLWFKFQLIEDDDATHKTPSAEILKWFGLTSYYAQPAYNKAAVRPTYTNVFKQVQFHQKLTPSILPFPLAQSNRLLFDQNLSSYNLPLATNEIVRNSFQTVETFKEYCWRAILIHKCLQVDPTKRYTMEQIIYYMLEKQMVPNILTSIFQGPTLTPKIWPEEKQEIVGINGEEKKTTKAITPETTTTTTTTTLQTSPSSFVDKNEISLFQLLRLSTQLTSAPDATFAKMLNCYAFEVQKVAAIILNEFLREKPDQIQTLIYKKNQATKDIKKINSLDVKFAKPRIDLVHAPSNFLNVKNHRDATLTAVFNLASKNLFFQPNFEQVPSQFQPTENAEEMEETIFSTFSCNLLNVLNDSEQSEPDKKKEIDLKLAPNVTNDAINTWFQTNSVQVKKHKKQIQQNFYERILDLP